MTKILFSEEKKPWWKFKRTKQEPEKTNDLYKSFYIDIAKYLYSNKDFLKHKEDDNVSNVSLNVLEKDNSKTIEYTVQYKDNSIRKDVVTRKDNEIIVSYDSKKYKPADELIKSVLLSLQEENKEELEIELSPDSSEEFNRAVVKNIVILNTQRRRQKLADITLTGIEVDVSFLSGLNNALGNVTTYNSTLSRMFNEKGTEK